MEIESNQGASNITEAQQIDAVIVLAVADLLTGAVRSLQESISLLENASPVLDVRSLTAELNRALPHLQQLVLITGDAGMALQGDHGLGESDAMQVPLSRSVSPRQLATFIRMADETGYAVMKTSAIYEHFTPPTSPQRTAHAPIDPSAYATTADYEISLRDHLRGNDVGETVFWTAVLAHGCYFCHAPAGRPCKTVGGWDAFPYHRDRRASAAQNLLNGMKT